MTEPQQTPEAASENGGADTEEAASSDTKTGNGDPDAGRAAAEAPTDKDSEDKG